jgi:hypothetical protein
MLVMKKRHYIAIQKIMPPDDPVVLAREQKQYLLLHSEPAKAEQQILELLKNPDTPRFSTDYFMLARCQESLGKHKEALNTYRLMFNNRYSSSTTFLNMGYYALCAIKNRKYADFVPAMEKATGKFYDSGGGEKYIQPVPSTSNVDIMKAYASYILSLGIPDDPMLELEKDRKKRYALQVEQETFYLQQAIDLGRGTVPGAYIQLAKLQAKFKPLEAQKTLDTFIQKYKKRYPEFAADAKEMRKNIYVPPNE